MWLKDISKGLLSRCFGRSFKYCSEAVKADVISFDVFGTLIFRVTEKPQDVFELISPEDKDFKRNRVEAEKKARMSSLAEDITLDDIYEHIADKYGVEQAELLKCAEIEKEMELTYANPEALRLYRYLKKMGKRIVITSDMYLPVEAIEKILSKSGFTGYEKLYVSGACGLSKRSGNLFKKIVEDCGTKNILHIGDHPMSDYFKTRSSGIRSFLYRKDSGIHVFAKSKKEVEQDCRKWAEKIGKEYTPELIVFIAKSGFLFAKPMAEYFGCEMVDIRVSRPGNDGKDFVRKLIPCMPRWLLFALLKSKASYGYQEKNSEREVITGERFEGLSWDKYKKILIVDDSTDTGFSLLSAEEMVRKVATNSEIRIASYCVIDISRKRVAVDYGRYSNTIVVTATSRYSKEYEVFLKELDAWERKGK